MTDIKRNNETPAPAGPAHGPVETKVERKPLAGNIAKSENIQVHFGNVEGLKLKLLQNINNGIQTLCDILDPDASIRNKVHAEKKLIETTETETSNG